MIRVTDGKAMTFTFRPTRAYPSFSIKDTGGYQDAVQLAGLDSQAHTSRIPSKYRVSPGKYL